ncbi:MAG: hypothetical protein J3Q66DRAFT_439502 [Benniella sp.]|nr:MAG: hypothetical protein J3Q66DRAFT_439502 [Benniella sp.]
MVARKRYPTPGYKEHDRQQIQVIMQQPISLNEETSSSTPVFFDIAEPTAVPEVSVVTMIPDSDRLTLKTHDSRYLSSGKFEIVSAAAVEASIQTDEGDLFQHSRSLMNHPLYYAF